MARPLVGSRWIAPDKINECRTCWKTTMFVKPCGFLVPRGRQAAGRRRYDQPAARSFHSKKYVSAGEALEEGETFSSAR